MSFEPIIGRYLTVTVQGRRQRIYVETAGQGAPVLCLHTAGADTRACPGAGVHCLNRRPGK